MAKKKIKIPIKEKLHYKKPLKSCNKAIEDISRIRNNEQAKLRRLNVKFAALPRGKKGKKKVADDLRKQIRAFERGIDELKGTVYNIREACKVLDGNKGKIKSLRLKAAHADRKLKKWPKKEVNSPEYKKLNNEFMKHWKSIKEFHAENTDILYRVNKGLGFEPEVIADRFNIDKDYLEKHFKNDFDEDYFEELEKIGDGEGEAPEGGGAAGGGFIPEEEEEEIEEPGYEKVMDEIFWQVSQNFTKTESKQLTKYSSVIIEFNGHTSRFAGTSISLIEMKFNEAVRWAETQPPYIIIAKFVSLDQTKLKYVFYEK